MLAAVLWVQSDLGLQSFELPNNTSHFTAAKRETYQGNLIQNQLWTLRRAAIEYALDDTIDFNFPDQASQLFSQGYLDDPLAFYSNGDTDPPPTTIDNDVSNAANSAQISFDYLGGGQTLDGPSTVLFQDNSADNNAGLGKYFTTIGSSAIGFEPANPRTFVQIPKILSQASPGIILRQGQTSQQGFDFDLPPNAAIESLGAPHQFDLLAEGSTTQALLDVFVAEGFSDRNTIAMNARGFLMLPDTAIIGPASTHVNVSAYLEMVAFISSPVGSEDVFAAVQANLGLNSTAPSANASLNLVGNQDLGFGSLGSPVVVSRDIISPSDPRFIAGLNSIELRLVAHLPITLDTSDEYDLRLAVAGIGVTLVDPNSTPGDFASVRVHALLPTTPDETQVKLYVPQGYSFSMNDPAGPNDLVFAAIKGDIDLNGSIGPADQTALIAAHTRPLGSASYSSASFDELSTFDFDGDGDIDCNDHQELVSGWNAGGSPSAFAICDSDVDTDGIPDGDDDCAGTPNGITVNNVGCPQGDFNQDGVFSANDMPGLTDCLKGDALLPNPTAPVAIAACQNAFDLDDDKDIDLADYALLQLQVQ